MALVTDVPLMCSVAGVGLLVGEAKAPQSQGSCRTVGGWAGLIDCGGSVVLGLGLALWPLRLGSKAGSLVGRVRCLLIGIGDRAGG